MSYFIVTPLLAAVNCLDIESAYGLVLSSAERGVRRWHVYGALGPMRGLDCTVSIRTGEGVENDLVRGARCTLVPGAGSAKVSQKSLFWD